MPTTKNIIIFITIGAAFVLVYFFFIKKDPVTPGLVSTTTLPLSPAGTTGGVGATAAESAASKDFLTLLLSIRGIRLDDSILSDKAFKSLDGTHSITLIPDGNEGRPNPFAPFGSDVVQTPTTTTSTGSSFGVGTNR